MPIQNLFLKSIESLNFLTSTRFNVANNGNLHHYHHNELNSAFAGASRERITTRQSADIFLKRTNSEIEKQTLNYKIAKQWNCLPSELKKLSGISQYTFNKKLKSCTPARYQSETSSLRPSGTRAPSSKPLQEFYAFALEARARLHCH